MKTNSIKPHKIDHFRQLPSAIEAEKSLLSAALLGAAPEIVEQIHYSDFYRTTHQIVFKTISDLVIKKQPVELPSVVEALRNKNRLEDVGGASSVALLVDTIPAAASIEHYCTLVKQAAQRRQIIAKCNDIARAAYDEPDHDSLLDLTQRTFLEIDSGCTEKCFLTYEDLAERMPEKWEHLGGKRGITGIPTGLVAIDKVLGGLQPSDLIVPAARPGMGKTAFAQGIAEGAASCGYPVLFFSLEMSAEQLYSRQTARTAHIDSQKFRVGDIEAYEWEKIMEAQQRLYEFPIIIDDTPRQHYMEILRRGRCAAREYNIKLIIIDYLQLIRGDSKAQRKDLEIADITGALKGLAKELNIPVVLLSQLNRSVELRDNRRPRLSDLRESGAIEQDADIVVFLYRDEYYHRDTEEKGIAEINFAKHRNGPTGQVRLSWIGWRACFENLHNH